MSALGKMRPGTGKWWGRRQRVSDNYKLTTQDFLDAEVRAGVLRAGRGRYSLGCNHRKTGACGGCYVRLYMALRMIEARPDAAERVSSAVGKALDAEDAAQRLGQPARKRGKR